jgi:membrane protease YdiL (CAAX protease family)
LVITIRRRRGLADAAIALALTVALVVSVPVVFRGSVLSPLLGYLAVWTPLLGAVLVSSRFRGTRSLGADVGLRFRPLDALWGLGAGFLARVAATLIEIGVYGRAAPPALTLDDGWWLFTAVLAPTVIAPVIEELFFRGLLLRAIERSAGPSVAVAVSSIAFAALHLLAATSPAQLLVVGLATLTFGVATGVLAVATGRIGGAIIAHVVFNALIVVPGLL